MFTSQPYVLSPNMLSSLTYIYIPTGNQPYVYIPTICVYLNCLFTLQLFFAEEAKQRISNHASQHSEDPLFLYLAITAPHLPLQAPEYLTALYPDIKDKDRRVYSAMVTGLDEAVGQVVESLKENGLYEDTIILFSSDVSFLKNSLSLVHFSSIAKLTCCGEYNSGLKDTEYFHNPI
jgi:hypothetical protein